MGEDHRDVIEVGHHKDNSSRCRSEKKNKLDINCVEVSHSEVVFMRYLSLLSLLILSFSVCSTFIALSSSIFEKTRCFFLLFYFSFLTNGATTDGLPKLSRN